MKIKLDRGFKKMKKPLNFSRGFCCVGKAQIIKL